MKILIILFILLRLENLAAQSESIVSVKAKNFEIIDDKVQIKFKLINAIECENYNISVRFTDISGKEIKPFSLSGDFKNISGQEEKIAIWDYSKDIDDISKIDKSILKIEKVEYKVSEVKIKTIPHSASAYIDGRYIGQTPLTTKLICGDHNLSIKLQEYLEYNENLSINKIKNDFLFTLDPVQYNLLVASRPSESDIFINNEQMGLTPMKFSLPEGKYHIEVAKRLYIPREKTISLKKNTLKKKNFLLHSDFQAGLGYIMGNKTQGGELIFRGKTVFILGAMRIQPLMNLDYQEYESSSLSVTIGYRIPYPIDFSIHGGYGLRRFSNKDNIAEINNFNTVVLGALLPVNISRSFVIYVKSDYWVYTEKEGMFIFSAGVLINNF